MLFTIPETLLLKGIPQVINIIDGLPKHPVKRYPQRNMDSVDTWIFHHSAHYASLKAHAQFHVNSRGWSGIAYSIIISDEQIYQTNYLDVQATHCAGWNHRSMGICINADLSKRSLTPRERELITAVFIALELQFPGRSIKGHIECTGKTSCPCTDMNIIRADFHSALEKYEYEQTVDKLAVDSYALAMRVKGLVEKLPTKWGAEAARKLSILGYNLPSEVVGQKFLKLYEEACACKFDGETGEQLKKLIAVAKMNKLV